MVYRANTMSAQARSNKSSVYHELVEAIEQPGCAVCRLIDRAVRQYVDVFFYENITTVARRTEIREARGYCSVHGALLTGHTRLLGSAIVHQDVINDVLRELNKTLPPTVSTLRHPQDAEPKEAARKPNALDDLTAAPVRNAALNAIRPKRMCPLCEYERDRESVQLRTLVDHMGEPEMRAAFEKSSGICLPHVQVMLGLRGVSADGLRMTLQIERDILQHIKLELEAYIAKSNGSYDFEGMGDESDSPLRAIKLVSGRVFGRR